MKIKLSKNQWEMVGKESGWLKKEAVGLGGRPVYIDPMEKKLLDLLNPIIVKFVQENNLHPAVGSALRNQVNNIGKNIQWIKNN